MEEDNVTTKGKITTIPWTNQQLNRFMVAEVCIDELMQVRDEFPGVFEPEVQAALETLQRGPWRGFVPEEMHSRGARMRSIRDRLDEIFPCVHRTTLEAQAAKRR